MPRAPTGLNVASRRRRDGSVERVWYCIRTGMRIGSSREGMTRERAIDILRAAKVEDGAAAPRHGSFGWLAAAFLSSPRFAKKAERTQRGYRAHLGKFRAAWGERNAETITRGDVAAWLADGAAAPWQTNAEVRTLRMLYGWARKQLAFTANPAAAPEMFSTPPRTTIWDEERIAAFLRATDARLELGFALMLYTVQRMSDVLAMQVGQVQERDGRLWLILRQQKTNELVAVPCHRDLDVIIRANLPRLRGGVLLCPSSKGKRWKARAFSAAWDRARTRANWRIARDVLASWRGMPPASKPRERAEAKAALRARMLYGLQRRDLRRTGMVMLALAGATTAQIAALSGHSIDQTAKILETYIPRRGEVALAGMEQWERQGTRALSTLQFNAPSLAPPEGKT